ncbi:MAG: PTS sugar transporter subunit IIA [Rhodoluna sp.]|nr:PTS sugar transporter subunit IIA [Rhodoluna sp.]
MSLIRVGVTANNFAEAITAAGELLVEAGHAKPQYIRAMIQVVEELGPYIVIADGIALAHAAPGDNVIKNSIALAVLEKSVDFGSGKMVKAVFAMAATDHDSHIESLGDLAALLADAEIRTVLLTAVESQPIELALASVLGE